MYQCILVDFSRNAYSKVDFGHVKISDAIFLGQSLLLSTTLLNDKSLILTFGKHSFIMLTYCNGPKVGIKLFKISHVRILFLLL